MLCNFKNKPDDPNFALCSYLVVLSGGHVCQRWSDCLLVYVRPDLLSPVFLFFSLNSYIYFASNGTGEPDWRVLADDDSICQFVHELSLVNMSPGGILKYINSIIYGIDFAGTKMKGEKHGSADYHLIYHSPACVSLPDYLWFSYAVTSKH